MGVIFEINRDFPYQVALPFDEVAMEVLAWLEGRWFEWDMYVDLPAGFQTSADATAFTRQFTGLSTMIVYQAEPAAMSFIR
jgi:hypothetical protein